MSGGTVRWPLMLNNITTGDIEALQRFLGQIEHGFMPRLTQGHQVRAFEEEFAQWLGGGHAVMVNSGASANLLTIAALQNRWGGGEVVVPAITWSSDIAAVMHAGMVPRFVDVDPRTLGMEEGALCAALNSNTRAVFLTHCLGFSALPHRFVRETLRGRGIALIEDCCEALGAYAEGEKLGRFGVMSNFSFYYAHHMSTIEGGMICTPSAELAEELRVLRSHGMSRERRHPKPPEALTWPEFTFERPGWNVRSTELNAVIGREQLKRVDVNNGERSFNLKLWLDSLPDKYRSDYRFEGSSNYALPLVLQAPDAALFARVIDFLDRHRIEYRRGTAGGGNMLRQPFVRNYYHRGLKLFDTHEHTKYPQAEHIHQFGLYIGNYPDLSEDMIQHLCRALNSL